MSLSKTITVPNGTTLSYHKILKVEITNEGMTTIVGSWPNEAIYLEGRPQIWTSYEKSEVDPATTLAIESKLLATGTFSDASVITDGIDSLDNLKMKRWAYIKQSRTDAIASPLTTPYGVFDCTPTARTSITDAVLMLQTLASMGTPTTIDFTLADNSVVTLNTSQMIEVGLMLGQKVQIAHSRARVLRLQGEAATTVAEVEAIVW
jgi:hypothetical protein